MQRFHPVRPLLAGTLLAALCLMPSAALTAAPRQEQAAPHQEQAAPRQEQSVPLQELAAYQNVSARLSALGFDKERADVLWSRMGPGLADKLDSGELSRPALEYLALSYCHADRLERYLAYGQANPALTAAEVVTWVNIGLDAPFYTGVQEIEDPDALDVLVNKYYVLPSDYTPELVRLGAQYGSGSLAPAAAEAFAAMADAARADGISLRSVSAYRSYQTQTGLYQRYTRQNGQALADTFSARPGHSEHQTGLALDINTARIPAHFERTPAYAWLQEHCAQFGFLLRYPQDKTAITGYCFEPWHYRYVGQEIASACMEGGLTYEEYLARRPVPGEYSVPVLAGWGAVGNEADRRLLYIPGPGALFTVAG